MKRTYLFIFLGIVILSAGFYFFTKPEAEPIVRPALQCQIAEMTYYYRPECPWCQRIDREETISKIKELGVNVREVNTRTGAVPRFSIDNEVYIGYRTFEELKELLGC